MGNKDAGRAVGSLDNLSYLKIMGGTINNYQSFNSPNTAIYRYFKALENYSANRIRWSSAEVDDIELRLIERNIFFYGYCALIKPIIINNGCEIKLSKYKVYQCNFSKINLRTLVPEQITLCSAQNDNVVIKQTYDKEEFVIFSSDFIPNNNTVPFCETAWEYANKLYELDLAFNANIHKSRLPMVFNTSANIDKRKSFSPGIGVSEVVRSAMGRNEQYVEISEENIGRDGFLHEPKHVENTTLEYLEAQKRLYQSFFEQLGLYTNKEKAGVYTVKRLQEDGDDTPDFITETIINSRVRAIKECRDIFNLDLKMEVI